MKSVHLTGQSRSRSDSLDLALPSCDPKRPKSVPAQSFAASYITPSPQQYRSQSVAPQASIRDRSSPVDLTGCFQVDAAAAATLQSVQRAAAACAYACAPPQPVLRRSPLAGGSAGAAGSEGAAAQLDGHNNTIEVAPGVVCEQPRASRIAAARAAISGFLVPPRHFPGVPNRAHGPDEVRPPEDYMPQTPSVVA
jgi:hypothetical protein